MLLGARVLDSEGEPGEDMSDSRIKAGVLLATPGRGGAELSPFAAEHFPFMNPSFADMTTPALVVAGDRDQSHLTARGPEWFTDPYFLPVRAARACSRCSGRSTRSAESPATTSRRQQDEHPGRVALIQRLTSAYTFAMSSILKRPAGSQHSALADEPEPLERVESD